MNNKLHNLINRIYDVMDHSGLTNSEKKFAIGTILVDSTQEYSQMSSLSFESISYMKDVEGYLKFQDKQTAFQIGEALVDSGVFKNEVVNPEDHRDILSNELPDWSQWEQRRLAKLWVLK